MDFLKEIELLKKQFCCLEKQIGTPSTPPPAPTTPGLTAVLTEDNDGGALQVKNILDPTDPQDAVTLAYLTALGVGFDPTPILKSVNDMQTDIAGNALLPGRMYAIIGSTAAQDIIVIYQMALTTNIVSKRGIALCYEADYQNISTNVTGQWNSTDEGNPVDGQYVIYNGQHWLVLDASSIDGTPPPINAVAYDNTVDRTSLTYYQPEINIVDYDVLEDDVYYRKDGRGNEGGLSKVLITEGNTQIGDWLTTFQWGSDRVSDNYFVNGAIVCINTTAKVRGNRVTNNGSLETTRSGYVGNWDDSAGSILNNKVSYIGHRIYAEFGEVFEGSVFDRIELLVTVNRAGGVLNTLKVHRIAGLDWDDIVDTAHGFRITFTGTPFAPLEDPATSSRYNISKKMQAMRELKPFICGVVITDNHTIDVYIYDDTGVSFGTGDNFDWSELHIEGMRPQYIAPL